MKSSITRVARLGALGVASALAFGGVAATSATAAEGAVAPTEGDAFDVFARDLFKDDAVTGVLFDGEKIIVQRLQDGAGAASAQINASAAATEIAEAYANVEIVPVTEDQLAKPTAATDVVGGYGIGLFDNSGNGGVCSVGFPAWTPDGKPAVLTAGHCTGDGAYNNVYLTDPKGDTAGGGAEDLSTVTPTHEVGQVGFNQFGGSGNTAGAPGDATDIAAIDVTNADLDLIAAMTDWKNTNDLSASLASNITGVGTAEVGETVQRSGRTTGHSTGEVDTDEFSFPVGYEGYIEVEGRLVKGFAAETQVIPGDSGGTILQGSTAVGVVTATFQDQNGVEHMWGADLKTGLEAAAGYTVKLDLPEAKVTDPDPDAPENNISWNAELSGTAGANAEVEYEFVQQGAKPTWDEKKIARTKADGEGNWKLTGPATPGDYTIYARSTSGFNTSDATSIDVQVFPTAPGITSPENGKTYTDPVTKITGNAAPNTEVTLSGDVNAKVTSDADGNWSHSVDLADRREYTVSAQQTINGKTSAPTSVTFTVGAAAPAAPEFINPVDGGSYVEGQVPTTITGTGTNGATVELRVGDKVVGTGTVDANVWSIKIEQLPVGEHKLAARQIVDGVASTDAVITITVTAAPQEPQQPEQPQGEESPAPQDPQQPQKPEQEKDGKLAPTGAEFNATAPIAMGLGLAVVAGGVLLIARRRQLNSER
ncbi:S1 family peptidase [Microbacterium barkeri]|uniref:S1 family peptidase n=1 Tax=Microbacterium barkeri TaxID=33917 RepID=UPI0024AEF249|nr:S1 family peptidase [Microbacterium barkeri]MDI6944757.1 S1 family peptidase [Microbacterium barkeri]